MSTLVTQTIQSNTSTLPVFKNSSGTEKGRLIKKYINFDGTFGTSPFTEANGGIRESFGISSVTDNGTGHYQLNFDGSMSNVNYTCVGAGGESSSLGGNNPERVTRFSDFATGTVQCRCRTATGGAADDNYMGAIIIGTN